MSNVLVVHPEDSSTDFLKLIYKGKDWDVISNCYISKNDLRKAISEHDYIIMLGHGTANGLLNPKYYIYGDMYIVDSSFADLLREKQTISIWCYSYDFFKHNNICDGNLHTGMVISEVAEAQIMLGYSPFTEDEMLANMVSYAKTISKCIAMPFEDAKKYFLKHYNKSDPVSKFNRGTFLSV